MIINKEDKNPASIIKNETEVDYYDSCCSFLMKIIPKEQQKRVFNSHECEIEPTFLGFVDTYEALSKIIPKHFTIIDFGAAYNPQSFFFTEHKKYIAVEPFTKEMFQPENCEIFQCTTKEFVERYMTDVLKDTNPETVFAICNAVPNWYGHCSIDIVRKTFHKCFINYPA